MTRITPGMCHLAGLFQWRTAAASLTLALTGAGPASAQDRSRPIPRDAREVTSVGAVQRAADDSISAERVKLPRLPSLEDLQDQQLAEMSEQIGGLKAENSRLRTQLASFRDEIDGIKSAMRPPPGYAAAFTTKRNWDGLEDGVGIRYYAPYPR